MAYDEELAARIRNALSEAGEVREQRMMGALCFMVDGHMCCGVTGNALMVRVGQDAHAEALKVNFVRPMEISERKPRGFVLVDPPGVKSERDLNRWVTRGRAFVSTLPAKS